MMKLFKSYIPFIMSFLLWQGCDTSNTKSGEYKILHLTDLKSINYQITDNIVKITDSNTIRQINFVILDSVRTGNSEDRMFTIGVESFSKETPDHLKEVVALAIGNRIGASQITILKDREAYAARITSDLNGSGGKQIEKLVQDSWEFNYIIK